MYFISTIFYEYDDLQNGEKYSILSLCDGDFIDFEHIFKFEVSCAEVFSKFDLDVFKISRIGVFSSHKLLTIFL